MFILPHFLSLLSLHASLTSLIISSSYLYIFLIFPVARCVCILYIYVSTSISTNLSTMCHIETDKALVSEYVNLIISIYLFIHILHKHCIYSILHELFKYIFCLYLTAQIKLCTRNIIDRTHLNTICIYLSVIKLCTCNTL